jgi:hypothetical protein
VFSVLACRAGPGQDSCGGEWQEVDRVVLRVAACALVTLLFGPLHAGAQADTQINRSRRSASDKFATADYVAEPTVKRIW